MYRRKRRLVETTRGIEGPTGAKKKCVRADTRPIANGLTLRIPFRNVFTNLDKLRLSNLLCDWVIKTNDDKEMPAHGAVLSLASPYFQKLLSDRWRGGLKTHTITIDVPARILQQILSFTYTGKCTLLQENVQHVLIAANEFLFYDVVQECYKFIMNQLRPENCVSLYQFTKPYFPTELSANFIKYICHHFGDVLIRNRQLMDLPIDELLTIVGSDDLNMADERHVLGLVVAWVNHDISNREQHVLPLFKCLRFGRMDINFLQGTVMNNYYVLRNPAVGEYLREAISLVASMEFHDSVDMHHPMVRQRYTNDVLLVFGGWTGNFERNYSFIEVFDKCASRWFPMKFVGAPNEREYYYHGVGVLGHNVYMVGGCCDSHTWSTTSKVVCFDPLRKVWEEKACMHEARSNVCVQTLNGLMYAIGGFDRFFNLESAESYDPKSNQWTKIAPMNDCRSEASGATLHGKIYVAGGFATDDVLQSVEVYNPATNQWSLINPMLSPRYGLTLVAYHNAIYAMGGNDGMGQIETVERYEPINAPHWTYVNGMMTSRKDFAAVVLDDKIFAIGGSDDWSSVSTTECFDIAIGEWTPGPQLFQKRCGLAACVLSGLQNAKEYSYVAFCANEEEERVKECNAAFSNISTV